MNPLQICPSHLSDVATLPWEIQKIIFQHYYSCTLYYLHYLRRKQIATVVLQLQLFTYSTYCCLMLPITCIALVLRLGHATGEARVPIIYGHAKACRSGLLRYGLNFSTTWCTVRLISV